MTQGSSNTDEQKDLALYTAQVNAWIESKMLHDRTLIQLSAAGIGLLVTILTAFGVETCLQFILYFVAFGLFLITILICMAILRQNAEHIQGVIQSGKTKGQLLDILDKSAITCFTLALIASFAIGVVAADTRMTDKGVQSMAKDKQRPVQMVEPTDNSDKFSINKIENLKPQTKDSAETPAKTSSSGDNAKPDSNKKGQ